MTKLHVINELSKGESHDLERDITYVGRSADNDISVRDKFVSRKHLKILNKENKCIIEDLKSTNGTFVNGRQIRPGVEYAVSEGLPIAIGISVICMGETCPEDILAFLNSIDVARDISRKFGLSIKDRRQTPQKNMELIYRVSNVLMESSDLREIAEKILNCIFRLLKRIDRGVLILIDRKTGKISEAITESSKSIADKSKKYSRDVVDRVIRQGKAVMIPDAQTGEDVELLETLKLMKIGSVMCVPLISRSQMLGAIYVDSFHKPYGFRKEDLSLLTTFASRAALAIENALLYANLEKGGGRNKIGQKGQKKEGEKPKPASQNPSPF
ncbi:MAG: FHA domain-containing protein [Desulfobacteraceae bacterium]|jgi:3',5'-cyclic-nucleotide phosphodiesterase